MGFCATLARTDALTGVDQPDGLGHTRLRLRCSGILDYRGYTGHILIGRANGSGAAIPAYEHRTDYALYLDTGVHTAGFRDLLRAAAAQAIQFIADMNNRYL